MAWTATTREVWIDGVDIAKLSSHELTNYRRDDVGFVFQFYNLVANLTAKENVELAAEIVKDALDAEEVLEQVGLGHRINNFPAQLSGGEQQRVAIARAVAKSLKFCFAMNQLALWTTKQVSRFYKSYKICPASRGNGDYRDPQ